MPCGAFWRSGVLKVEELEASDGAAEIYKETPFWNGLVLDEGRESRI